MFVFFAEYFMQKDKHATLAQLAQAPKADYFEYLDEKIRRRGNERDRRGRPGQERERDYDVDTFKIWLKQTSFDEGIDEKHEKIRLERMQEPQIMNLQA